MKHISRLIILLVLSIALLVLVEATLTKEDSNLIDIWYLNDSAGNPVGYVNNNILTVTGSVSYKVPYNLSNITTYSLNLGGTGYLNCSSCKLPVTGWTILFFQYTESAGEYQCISNTDASTNGFYWYQRHDQDKNHLRTYGGDNFLLEAGTEYDEDMVWCTVLMMNSTEGSLWRNGTNIGHTTGSYTPYNRDLVIGTQSWPAVGASYWNTVLQYFAVFNRSFTPEEIKEFCTTGIRVTDEPIRWLDVDITHPLDNEYLSTNIRINNTVNETTNNCTINDTRFKQDFLNGTYYSFLNDSDVTDGRIWINISCENNISDGSDVIGFYIDSTPPTITVDSPNMAYNETYNTELFINISTDEITNCSLNDTSFSVFSDNESYFIWNSTIHSSDTYHVLITCNDGLENSGTTVVYFTYDVDEPTITYINPGDSNTTSILNIHNITIDLHLFDNIDLYSFDINMTNSSGYVFQNETVSLSGRAYNYTDVILTESMENTTYYVSLRLCDSHTKSSIDDALSLDIDTGEITYHFEEYYIKLRSDDTGARLNTTKLKDRYTIEYIGTKEEKQKFYIESDKDIIYLKDSKFSGHFIIENHWIDFEPYDVVVYKTNDIYTVEIKGAYKELDFNSIGELNCIENTVSFALIPNDLNPYGFELINFEWFNEEVLDLKTSSGVLIFIFIFLIIAGFVALSEYSQIPIFMILTGISGFFVGIMLYATVTAVIGFFFIVFSALYILRGLMATK